jgi:hypothetical protein
MVSKGKYLDLNSGNEMAEPRLFYNLDASFTNLCFILDENSHDSIIFLPPIPPFVFPFS